MLPTVPGQMATVLVALAVTDPRPSQIRAGKETSVPPPATELMAPARKAAPKATAACPKSSTSTDSQLTIQCPIFPLRPSGFTLYYLLVVFPAGRPYDGTSWRNFRYYNRKLPTLARALTH